MAWAASATTARRSASRSPSGTGRTPSSRSGSSASTVTRATTARTPRSTGGISTRHPPTRGCAGGTCTRSPASPTRGWSRRTRAGAAWTPSTSWSTAGSSPTGGTSRSPPTTRRPARRTSWSSSRCATWGRRRRTSTCSPPSGSGTPGRGTPAITGPRSAPRAGACGRRTTSSAAAGSTACPAPSRSSATTRPTRAASGVATGPRTPRTASTTTSSPELPPSTRASGGPRPLSGIGSPSPRAGRDRCGCASTGAPGPRISGRASPPPWSSGAARLTSSSPHSRRPGGAPTRRR